jgi:uncharacterized protein (TIGR00255 family)
MQSMTAFSRTQGDHARFHLVWELRTVNHRYLETQFRLPDAFRNLEQVLRDTARKHLKGHSKSIAHCCCSSWHPWNRFDGMRLTSVE